uniref:Uncharacterized protein n=1 Tax=Bicosoecida sp. CB-2014 TaxID=1486930 RepID=A0A7S1G3R3_9STRA|mmetsp:Transcript_11500/g.40122  ORF Transcript_11500/g.40122 Transcript_11500/m.40122 type:complete len:248 (+) Transcript_11500:88-831(+)
MPRVEFVSLAGLRVDGRRPAEVRKLRCRMGLFGRADGSAYLEQGNTKAVAVVYGPKQITRRADALHDRASVNCEFSTAPFAGSERKKVRASDRRAAEASLMLKQTFEGVIQRHLYPRSQIDIFVQVLQADGGERAAAINVATLALIDAGIAMDDFVVACTAGFLDDTALLDLNSVETGPGGPRVEVAMVPQTGKLTAVQMESRLPVDHFEAVLELALSGCRHIFDVLQAAVREHTLKRLDTRGVLPG